MPVPTATSSREERPRPTPQRASPRPWACTSFSTLTGTPNRSANGVSTSVPAQPVSEEVAWVTRPRPLSITPAEESPTARTAVPAATCAARSRAAPRIAAGPEVAGVATSATCARRGVEPPSPSWTRAARIFVPPRSRARTGSGIRAGPCPVEQPGRAEDLADAVHRRALDRRHRGGHGVGLDEAQPAQGRREGAPPGGGTHPGGGLDGDREHRAAADS